MAKQPETKVKFSIFNKEFNEGINEMSKENKKLRKEFKLQEEQMKDTGSATDKLELNIKRLSSEQETVKKKIKATADQLEKTKKIYGENSDGAEKLAGELLDLKISEQKLENAINKSKTGIDKQAKAMDSSRRDAEKLKRSLKDVADSADKVGEKMTNVGQTLTASITAPIVGFGALAVESTRELREDMAKLETNAKQAGAGVGVAEDALRDLNSITGETDSNIEALSNLMAVGLSDSQLKQAVDDLSGAVIKFPDTLKIEGVADGLQETLATGKAMGTFAELLERMGVDLETFDEGLQKAAESGEDTNYVLNQLNDLDLSKVNKEFRETNKELVEGKEAQYDFMQAMAELGQKLEPIATKLTDSVTEIIDAFNELEPATQDNIIKFAGMAAAVGPLAIGLGSVTRGVSSLTTGLIGGAGGKGLLGSIAGLSRGGIVGLAIGGVAALGLGIYALSSDQKELQEVSLETANSLTKQYESNGKLIDSLDKLRGKSLLTNDEFARYIDLQSELKKASDPQVIKDIEKEMGDLEGKSNLTNDELSTMVGLNNDITESLPGATKEITDQGNKIADTTGKLEKYNEEISKMATLEMEDTFNKAAKNESILQQKKVDQQKTLNMHKGYETILNGVLNDYNKESVQSAKTLLEEEAAKLRTKINSGQLSGTELEIARKQEKVNGNIRLALQGGEEELKDQLLTTKEQISEQKIKLEKTDIELSKLDQVYEKLQINYLKSAGITDAKARQAVQDGKILETIDKQIAGLDKEKDKLNDLYPPNQRNTEEYEKAAGEIDNQINKLETTKGKINGLAEDARNFTDELGNDVDKNVNVNASPSISWLDEQLKKTVNKRVEITGVGNSLLSERMWGNADYNADGTSYHPGGPSWVGEEGPELVNQKGKWSLQGFGLMPDLSQGAQVFTHEQTKKILSGMNQLPAYASGVGVSDTMARNINITGQNLASRQESMTNRLTVSIEASDVIMDGRAVGSITWKPIKEFIDREEGRNGRF